MFLKAYNPTQLSWRPLMRTKGGAGVRTTFWSVQGEGPVSFLKGLG